MLSEANYEELRADGAADYRNGVPLWQNAGCGIDEKAAWEHGWEEAKTAEYLANRKLAEERRKEAELAAALEGITQRGHACCMAGAPIEACPYQDQLPHAAAWKAGWRAAAEGK